MTHRARTHGAAASMLSMLVCNLVMAAVPASQESTPASLVDIDGSPDTFIERFNGGEGRSRFVAVLSPT